MSYTTENKDTFTEAVDKNLSLHTGDTGETWAAALAEFFCDAARGVAELRSYAGTNRFAFQATGGEQFEVGDEVFCDLFRSTGHSGANNTMGFYCMVGPGGLAPTDYYMFRLQFTATVQVECFRFSSGGNQTEVLVPGVPIAQETWIRLGATIVSADEYDLWWEPWGGGTRFAIGTWSPTPDTQYDYLESASHTKLGINANATTFVTGAPPAWNNLTHQRPVAAPTNPPITNRLTYQRVLNIARQRSRDFVGLIIDDNQIMDELNAITLELLQEGSDADVSAFQQTMNWATDVAPSLMPVPTDLRALGNILVPGWVQTIFAVEGLRSNGSKIEIGVQRKESETRDRIPDQDEGFGFYTALLDQRLRKPRAWRVWDGSNSVWRLYKDLTSEGGEQTWQDIIDVNIVVSGIRIAMTERPDLNDEIPLPFRALRPLAEAYALILGGRPNKNLGWMRDQRVVKQQSFDSFREYINQSDMSRDEPFDPEIGLDWQ